MRGGGAAAAGRGAAPKGGKGLVHGAVKGKGKGPAAAAAAGEQRMGAAAALAAICAYEPDRNEIIAVPELAAAPPAVDCCVGPDLIVVLALGGGVFCQGCNDVGQLGAGDAADREDVTAARLPWPAAAVSCGGRLSVALSGEGAVCSWGQHFYGILGRGGSPSLPTEIKGLPQSDPVVHIAAGCDCAFAVTAAGDVYGWGQNRFGQLALHEGIRFARVPQRIAQLSGRGLKRIACGFLLCIAECPTELLYWGHNRTGVVLRQPVPLRASRGSVAFPLRSLICVQGMHYETSAVAADAAGRLWCLWDWADSLVCGGLPAEEHAVRVAGCHWAGSSNASAVILALSAEGRLWDCRAASPCRRVAATHGPLGLLPCGGPIADRIVLIPDRCGGKGRLRLFARVAMRLGVPSDPVQQVLCRLTVHGDYMTGEDHDPFGFPGVADQGSDAH